MNGTFNGKRFLLIIGGGIAAYKSCELVRLIRKQGGDVTCVLTEGGAHFVTAMTLAALSENPVHTTLWDLKNEVEMGHIQLSRQADLVVVCPATADLMARMAGGSANDLATTLLLATDKPVLAVPAMNVRMWQHPATVRNVATLRGDGVAVMEPDEGAMACGEFGPGRLPEPAVIVDEIARMLAHGASTSSARAAVGVSAVKKPAHPELVEGCLSGKHILITAGPTHEPIDPVRYIANRSSGKQGFAIAAAAAKAGAQVTLIAGPVNLDTPQGVTRVDVETARQMATAVDAALPADVAIMVAAVADWRSAGEAAQKIKKDGSGQVPPLQLVENPDILATLCKSDRRPALVVGFAAETNDVLDHARAKLARKGADWIVANDVATHAMGGEINGLHIVSASGVESLPELPKAAAAAALIERIAHALA
ncbi:MAG: bifunctional phosphopantothenoylcysteine decarboxylase/phosphopantothenate synthase [Novosphingobium sp. 28-62-57]|uniref:bifunctional phosphopantothenoylcysteine decarboxylase/phosphopantothenate synthase n=1 Tax=unclassified Novosphingobium TaxID=2644732 RepID=UPI000BD3FD9E|nr:MULTISPECIES: bifunctional phosphopantothenoylcysteine decarboxylase/phosphopantothenate synthase [unclassified Novosphingobium]OYW48482.1 MAG: bifunctional phosphopantothenoylcysteine decarboxylase/phosphopantothenate synthase [Novosphingobium sp. 12-62-10]OYZ09330.1 MAG: bifunctional phosphopantothenoylcysteine decarboxylase/phosphopantothenate synthase [Novosphingobium sp. 28-62-57]OZA39147.1 MAG: bifunctional phosphopantothenoylcysteine decarboxylase/phosphopantothenate synthase [Novosphi